MKKTTAGVLLIALLITMTSVLTVSAFNRIPDNVLREDGVYFHFLDVNSLPLGDTQIGSADCILIQDHGVVTLIDTGTAYKISTDKVIDYIANLGITVIDNLILTHGHGDHVGGVAAIVEAFDIKKAFYSSPKDWTRVRPMEIDWRTRQKFDIAILAIDRKVNSDGSFVEVITPDEEGKVYTINENSYFTVYNSLAAINNNYREPEFNDFSVMLKYTHKNVNALFTGDINLQYEYTLLGEVDQNGNRVSAGSSEAIDPVGEIQIFKLPHHGTEGSLSTETLFSHLNPSKNSTYLAVVTGHTANIGNSTYPRIEKYGYQYRCTHNGDIIVYTDGTDVSFL